MTIKDIIVISELKNNFNELEAP